MYSDEDLKTWTSVKTIQPRKDYTKESNPANVKAIVHAQDIIGKTQKEQFDNLLTSLGNNDVHI